MSYTGKKLGKILSDSTSGSTGILLKLINLCRENYNDSHSLAEIISVSQKHFKSFSSIQSFSVKLKKIIKQNQTEEILKFLNETKNKIEDGYSVLFRNAFAYFKNAERIVTLSNSRTVTEILIKLAEKRKIKVTISESRPMLEGRIMAKELVMNGIQTEIIPDAYLSNSVEKSDIAVTGADMILENGDVVNKTGSRNLAILCKHFRKPYYVLAASDKLSGRKKYYREQKDGKEIWDYKHERLKKTNFYFEAVEKKLITRVITDSAKS